MSDIDGILKERGSRYGPFRKHAEITQQLKQVISPIGDPVLQEALDMISHKIGRIVNGDPYYVDSWDDIAGYAKLAADYARTGGTTSDE